MKLRMVLFLFSHSLASKVEKKTPLDEEQVVFHSWDLNPGV